MTRLYGAIALLGVGAVLVADLLGIIVVEAHNPISETISRLAVGPHAWIQDLGINFLGVGTAVLAAGLRLWRRGGAAWRMGVILVALLGLDFVLIAEYNQYAGELGQGAMVHRTLVIVMFVLFVGASLILAEGLGKAGRRWKMASLAAGGAWLVLAPLLFVMPTAIDGGYERLVSLIMLGWIAGVSVLLLRYAPDDAGQANKRKVQHGESPESQPA